MSNTPPPSPLLLALIASITALALPSGVSAAGPLACVEESVARFLSKMSRAEAPLLTGGPPESASLRRRGLALRGHYFAEVQGVDANEGTLTLAPRTGTGVMLGSDEYIEFPNSAAGQTVNPLTHARNEFLLPRAVRAYWNKVNLHDGSQAPQDYVSDVPLMTQDSDGHFRFRRMILRSAPEKRFLFEDPRLSKILDDQGKEVLFLSGTDYSPHVPGSPDSDIMNRYVELSLDESGLPREVPVDPATLRPDFLDLSPAPFRAPDGSWIFVDAKNASLTRNHEGQLLVDTRLRPDFKHPYIQSLFGDLQWQYAMQTFAFKGLAELKAYDWRWSLVDLARPGNTEGPPGRVRPAWSKVQLRNQQMPQLFHDPRVVAAKSGGVGWGSQAIWVERRGNELWFGEQPGQALQKAGRIRTGLLEHHRLQDGEGELWNFGHSILYFKENGFLIRHYSTLLVVRDGSGKSVKAVFDKISQPIRLYERGYPSGIVDLQHTYPMGRTLDVQQSRGKVRSYEGTSDAHTARKDYDILTLDEEMQSGSPRWTSGQIFKP